MNLPTQAVAASSCSRGGMSGQNITGRWMADVIALTLDGIGMEENGALWGRVPAGELS
ncbi:hypothetical protein [Klebsiella pneumoniae]|uniref:hypothetical protein n=1 Tax=Klebsiella pneumoniae TaxID=573 RepID=UPI00388F7D6A